MSETREKTVGPEKNRKFFSGRNFNSLKHYKLAIDGGESVLSDPIKGVGNRFGKEEEELLIEVLRSGKLNKNVGTKVKEFEDRFKELLETKHAIMSTSGTAAIHIALGGLNLDPGSEIITSPITDMGSIMPIFLSLCVPVFADLDKNTWEIDPEDVEQKITSRTKAILAIHLIGNSCNLKKLREIADRHNIYLIEDCAQAYGTTFDGKHVGSTYGDISCFSLNQCKHITCGDAGVTVTNNDAIAERARLFADKAWPRDVGRTSLFVAPNYRVTELQAAVALPQLKKIEPIAAIRKRLGDLLSHSIKELSTVEVQGSYPNSRNSYWFYAFAVDADIRNEFADALMAEGVPCTRGYIPKPVYTYEVFHNGKMFGESNFPYGHEPYRPNPETISYDDGICPFAEVLLESMIKLPFNEFWTEEEINKTAEAIRKVHYWLVDSGA